MKSILKFSPVFLLVGLIGIATPKLVTQRNSPQVYAQNKQQTEQPLVVIAYLQVKPEHRQTFIDLATTVAKLTNKTEPGANSYSFYESQDTPNSFFFFEDWENEAAFEAHLQKSYTKSLIDKYPEILAESADVRIYRINNVEQKLIP